MEQTTAPETKMESAVPLAPSAKKQHLVTRIKEHKNFVPVFTGIVLVILILAGYTWYTLQSRVYTDKAHIVAPLIDLSPSKPEILKKILVKIGDHVEITTPVARLDDDYVYPQTPGIVVGINDEVGKMFSPGMSVVTMIDPAQLRVVARVEENKGFSDIKIGQKVIFTVDAYGSKKFEGTVDEIAKTSEQSDIAFSISDKRETKLFEIKIKYDVNEYPDLLNGMSVKAWIYK